MATVLNNPAVFEFELTICRPAKNLVMSYDHDGEPFLVELSEQADDGFARGTVEISGRFIGQNERGVVYEGARDRHSLHFASG